MLINSLHTLYNVAIDKVRKVWTTVDTEREREDTTMIQRVREFFSIKENKIKIEWMDISTILTVINVVLIITGFWWAPIIGIINATANIIMLIIKKGHINGYVLNMALLIMNIYFLKG